MPEQVHIFLNAVMFFTRIPVPSWTRYEPDYLHKASAWFPLIGWIVGGVGALVWLGARQLFPVQVAVALSMVATILLTGAFHEDGLADTADGFGGGWQAERILEIMKDSRLGTFGAVALMAILALKWMTLSNLPPILIAPALFCGHALSRFAPTILIRFGNYARKNEDSKAKPLATHLSTGGFLIATVFGLLPLAFFPGSYIWWSLLPVLWATLWLKNWFEKWISGYTGDTLGAVQQVTEVLIYLTILGMTWNSI